MVAYVAGENTGVLTSFTGRGEPYREAQGRQSLAVLCSAGFGWLCCDWQQRSLSLTNRQDRQCGAEGSAEHSGPRGWGIKIQSRTGAAWKDVLVNVVIQKVCSSWCSSLTASRTAGLCLWRRILDSLPWESSKLCCSQTTLSSAACVILFFCMCLCFNTNWRHVCELLLHSPWCAVVQFALLSRTFLSLALSIFLCCSLFSAWWNVQFGCSWSWTPCSPEVGG